MALHTSSVSGWNFRQEKSGDPPPWYSPRLDPVLGRHADGTYSLVASAEYVSGLVEYISPSFLSCSRIRRLFPESLVFIFLYTP